MGNALGVHGVDEAEVIDMLGDVGKEAADPATGLAVLFEIPKGLEEFALAFLPKGLLSDADEVEGLAIAFDELGFVVEGIDMAGTAGHEEKDDALGLPWKDGRFWGEGVVVGGGVAAEERGEREGAEAAAGGF